MRPSDSFTPLHPLWRVGRLLLLLLLRLELVLATGALPSLRPS